MNTSIVMIAILLCQSLEHRMLGYVFSSLAAFGQSNSINKYMFMRFELTLLMHKVAVRGGVDKKLYFVRLLKKS